MSLGYGRLYRRTWASFARAGLDPLERLVAIYLLNGQSNRIGLYRLSLALAGEDMGLSPARVDTLCDRVCHRLSWERDKAASVVYIPTWWRWNCPDSVKTLIGYLKDLGDVPDTPLISMFANNLCYLKPDHHDTLSHTLCHRLSVPKPYPEPEIEPIPSPKETYCAEPSGNGPGGSAPSAPPVFSLPLNDGTSYPISQAQVDRWDELYPALDIPQTLREMIGWLEANPTRRKTRSGVLRFCAGWMAKEQNRAPAIGGR